MRKIIQIAYEVSGSEGDTSSIVQALCDDGTVWYRLSTKEPWMRDPAFDNFPYEDKEEEAK